MTVTATILLLIATGAWAGAILFQSAIVAPSVFSALDAPSARKFLRMLFPRFFRLGVICSTLALATTIILGAAGGWQSRDVAMIGLSALMALLAVGTLMMIPAINSARDAGESGAVRFTALHRMSVAATVIMLAIGLSLIALVGTRAAG